MRTTCFFIGATMLLALAAPAPAQTGDSGKFLATFNGVNPRGNITLVPVDTNAAMRKFNINSAFKTPTQQKAFSMANIFPKISLPSFPPKVASTPILPQQNNPFQPNPIVGYNPFMQPTK